MDAVTLGLRVSASVGVARGDAAGWRAVLAAADAAMFAAKQSGRNAVSAVPNAQLSRGRARSDCASRPWPGTADTVSHQRGLAASAGSVRSPARPAPARDQQPEEVDEPEEDQHE